MDEVIRRKVGVVSCSGEEIAEGTVARLATLKVLHDLRAAETVTICLPLFLAGGEGDREFARFHPTITVDGCALRCAARGTEMYSAKPAASVVVSDLLASAGLPPPRGRRSLDEAGRRAVGAVAEHITQLVDGLLGRSAAGTHVDPPPLRDEQPSAMCPCGGGGVPASNVGIGERAVRVQSGTRTATYHADVRWLGEHWGQVVMGNGPEMKFSAPPEAHGHPGVLTPEDAFVAAANTCFMLMVIWAAERFRLKLLSYECRTEGTKLVEIDRTEVFTRLHFRPVIRVAAAGESKDGVEARVKRALAAARKYSLVANSVKSAIEVEPEIVVEERSDVTAP